MLEQLVQTQQVVKIMSVFMVTSYGERPVRFSTFYIGSKITKSCQEYISSFSSHSWWFSLKSSPLLELWRKLRLGVNRLAGYLVFCYH